MSVYNEKSSRMRLETRKYGDLRDGKEIVRNTVTRRTEDAVL